MGKGDKPRRRRERRAHRQNVKTAYGVQKQAVGAPAPATEAERPTPERMRRGVWNIPKGQGAKERAVTDLAEDMIGQLLTAEIITKPQEEAARRWQELRLAYLAEFPETGGFKSCISPDVPGYDDGDGDPEVIESYRDVERALGREAMREVIRVCEDNQRPSKVWLLRWALEALRV